METYTLGGGGLGGKKFLKDKMSFSIRTRI